MSTIKCAGIIAPVDTLSNTIMRDKDGKFNIIPITLAQKIEKQTDVPILIAHKNQYIIGHVDKFCITHINVLNKQECVLCVEFTINDPNFIQALKEVTSFKYIQWMGVNVFSPDDFISSHSANCEDIYKITADIALMQKFAGLSIGHNRESGLAEEVSICMAGQRPLTVITSAKFHKANNSKDHIDPLKVKSYKEIFTVYSFSIRDSANKVESDLQLLSLPGTCLLYDQRKMLHVDGHNVEEKKEVSSDQTKKLLDDLLSQIHKINGGKNASSMKTKKRKRDASYHEDRYGSEDSSSDDACFEKPNRTKVNKRKRPSNYAYNDWHADSRQPSSIHYPNMPQSCVGPGSPFMIQQQPQYCLPYQQHQHQAAYNIASTSCPPQTQYHFQPIVHSHQMKNTSQEEINHDNKQSMQIDNTMNEKMKSNIAQDINNKLQELSTSIKNQNVNTSELAQLIVQELRQHTIINQLQESSKQVLPTKGEPNTHESFITHNNVPNSDAYSLLPTYGKRNKLKAEEQTEVPVDMDQVLQEVIDNI